MPKPKRDAHLSDLQLAVMRALWRRGSANTAEVVAELGPKRDLAHTTVATLLTRLEKRGLLETRRDGRTLVYTPLISEPDVRRSMVADLVASLFKGDPKALLAHLVREDEIAPGDLEKIRARLKEDEHG